MSKLNILHIVTSNSISSDIDDLALSLNNDFNSIILSITLDQEKKVISTSVSQKKGITYISVSYPSSKNIFSKTRTFLNSVTNGLSKLIDLNIEIDLVCTYHFGKSLWVANKYFSHTPIIFNELSQNIFNSNFEKLPKRKQKKNLKNINNSTAVFINNSKDKQTLDTLKVEVPIHILTNNFEELKNSILKIYNQHLIPK